MPKSYASHSNAAAAREARGGSSSGRWLAVARTATHCSPRAPPTAPARGAGLHCTRGNIGSRRRRRSGGWRRDSGPGGRRLLPSLCALCSTFSGSGSGGSRSGWSGRCGDRDGFSLQNGAIVSSSSPELCSALPRSRKDPVSATVDHRQGTGGEKDGGAHRAAAQKGEALAAEEAGNGLVVCTAAQKGLAA